MSTATFSLGQRAEVITTKLEGRVRYKGALHFIAGQWLGLELDEPKGKNDGLIKVAVEEASPAVASLEAVLERSRSRSESRASSGPDQLEIILAREEIDSLKEENKALEARIEDLEIQLITPPEGNDHDSSAEIACLREALIQFREISDEETREANTTIKSLSAEVEELKKRLNDVTSQDLVIFNLQNTVDEQDVKLVELQQKLEDIQALSGLQREEISLHLEEITRISDELAKWNEIAQLGVSDIIELKHTVADQDTTIDKFRQWSSELQTNLIEAQDNKEVSQQEQAKLEKRAQQYKELAEKTEKSAIRTQHASLLQSLDKARAVVAEERNTFLESYTRRGFESARHPIDTLSILRNIHVRAEGVQEHMRAKAELSHSNDDEAEKICIPKCVSLVGQLKLASDFMGCYLHTAPLSTFLEVGKAYNELAIIEKDVNSWADGLLRDSLRETQLMEQSRKTVNHIKHVVEKYIPGPIRPACSLEICILDLERQMLNIETGLDSIKTLHGYLEEMLDDRLHATPESDELDHDQRDEHKRAITKNRKDLQSIERHSHTMLELVRDLKQRRMLVNSKIQNNIDVIDHGVHETLDTTWNICRKFSKIINEERYGPVDFLDIRPAVGIFPYEEVTKRLDSLLKEVLSTLELMNNPNNLDEMTEEEDTQQPWILHNFVLDGQEADLHDAAEKLTTAKVELAEKNTTIAVKNKTIEELSVSVEVLTKRVNDFGAHNDKIIELKRTLKEAAEREITLNITIDKLLSQLEKNLSEEKKVPEPASRLPAPQTALIQRMDVDLLTRQIEALAAALRITVIRDHSITDFEHLDQNPKPEPLPEIQTIASMQAAYEEVQRHIKNQMKKENKKDIKTESKKEMKKKPMAWKKHELLGDLHSFRRAAQR